MLRRLLTLLAVISGLTLTAAPVQASSGAQAVAVQVAERADCIVQATRPLQLVETDATGPASRRPCARPAVVIHVPTVQLQADRARE